MGTLFRRCNPCAGGGGVLNIGWFNPARGQPETIIPTLANPTFRTPGLNAWSVWSQVIAATLADLVLLAVHTGQIFAESQTLHYQLARGAAGAEVPIAEWSWGGVISGAGSIPSTQRTFRLGPVKIAAGTRLAVRGWSETAGTGVPAAGHYFSLIPPAPTALWEPWTDTYIGGTKATNLVRTPAVAGYTLVPAGGAWTQLIAAAASNMLLNGAQRQHTDGGHDIIEIGTGAAGAEVAHSRIGFPGSSLIVPGIGYQEPGRKSKINAGERVAARVAFGAAADLAIYTESI